MSTFDILRRPIVTEKSTGMQSRNRYVFEVPRRATKHQIKEAVQLAFDVTVLKVNTMNVRGKRKRYGQRFSTKPSWKKAIVTLSANDSITLFEGV